MNLKIIFYFLVTDGNISSKGTIMYKLFLKTVKNLCFIDKLFETNFLSKADVILTFFYSSVMSNS